MAPNAAGSSTMGVKKSPVDTSARSSVSRNTAASSPVVAPTSTRGSSSAGRAPRTCPSSTGLSLQPQPAPWLYSVSLSWVSIAAQRTAPGKTACVRCACVRARERRVWRNAFHVHGTVPARTLMTVERRLTVPLAQTCSTSTHAIPMSMQLTTTRQSRPAADADDGGLEAVKRRTFLHTSAALAGAAVVGPQPWLDRLAAGAEGPAELALLRGALLGAASAGWAGDPPAPERLAARLGEVWRLNQDGHYGRAMRELPDLLAGARAAAASVGATLAAEGGDDTPDRLSVHGLLVLGGAEAAADRGDRHLAEELFQEAEHAARRLGRDANHRHTAFGPTNVEVHRIHAAVLLGEPEAAVV